MKQKLLKSALCLFLLLPACNNDQDKATSPAVKTDTQAPVTTTTETAALSSDTAQQGQTISGKVLECMDSGGYTYMKLNTGDQPWIAIPQAEVKAGDDVACYNGMVMSNFTSKTLNRTFDSIIFSSGLVKNEPVQPATANSAGADSFASAVKEETPEVNMAESGGSVGAVAPFTEIKVEKAKGDNSYTVEEIFTQSSKLDGKTIRVQGKVTKFSPNIMGKNWIHLQDGSGDPLKNTHDLVVTTNMEPPQDQDIITIEGTVRANKDFGAGYSYEVMIEEAQLVK